MEFVDDKAPNPAELTGEVGPPITEPVVGTVEEYLHSYPADVAESMALVGAGDSMLDRFDAHRATFVAEQKLAGQRVEVTEAFRTSASGLITEAQQSIAALNDVLAAQGTLWRWINSVQNRSTAINTELTELGQQLQRLDAEQPHRKTFLLSRQSSCASLERRLTSARQQVADFENMYGTTSVAESTEPPAQSTEMTAEAAATAPANPVPPMSLQLVRLRNDVAELERQHATELEMRNRAQQEHDQNVEAIEALRISYADWLGKRDELKAEIDQKAEASFMIFDEAVNKQQTAVGQQFVRIEAAFADFRRTIAALMQPMLAEQPAPTAAAEAEYDDDDPVTEPPQSVPQPQAGASATPGAVPRFDLPPATHQHGAYFRQFPGHREVR